MANDITYTIPTIGTTPDPQWEVLLNTALTAIKTHTHDGSAAGTILPPTAISFASAGFNFNNQAQTNAAYFDVAQQSSLPSQTAGHGRLACNTSGDLYYVSPTTNVLLASSTSINYSAAAKGFVGSNYGSTGGAAFYNTASATWPFNSTFYFYSSTSTPTNDTGSRAGLAGSLISLKGAAGSAATVFIDDTSSATTERGKIGLNSATLGRGGYGLAVIRAVGVGTYAPALTIAETSTSAGLPNTADSAARAYGFYLNGSPADGTANDVYHYGIRGNLPGVGNNTISDFGYICKNYSDGAGNAFGTADGFGMRHRWHLQTGASFGVGALAGCETISWANHAAAKGRYGLFAGVGGASHASPGFEVCVNSAGSLSCGIGVAANYAGTGLAVALDTAITGTLTTSGALTVSGGGAAITGAVTASSTMAVTGNTTVGGSLVAAGTVVSAVAIQGATAVVTSTSTTTGQNSSSMFGFATNYLVYTDGGGAANYNAVLTANHAAGENTITFPWTLSTNAIVIPVVLNAATTAQVVSGGGGSSTVRVKTSDGANHTVAVLVVGG